jgi:DNA-binding MarR family transcriptional regulator
VTVHPARDKERQRIRRQLVDLLRTYSVEAQHVGHAFAQRHGLHPTDLQALIAVLHAEGRGDPLTPGRLGTAIGLSSGATTAAVDRLERSGHLRRTRESSDRRVVHLRYGEPGRALAHEFFGPLGERGDAVMDRFTDAELDTVHRFLEGMTDALTAHHHEVRAGARVDAGRAGNRTAMTDQPTAETPEPDEAESPELPPGEDVRPGPELTDEPKAGATEPAD